MTKRLTLATGDSLLIHDQSESDVISILEMKDYPLNRLSLSNPGGGGQSLISVRTAEPHPFCSAKFFRRLMYMLLSPCR